MGGGGGGGGMPPGSLPGGGVGGHSPQRRPSAGSGPGGAPLQPPEERFGILGLLGVIRMTDPDLNMLALGTDLTALGLNLNSSEPLYQTFSSPWSDTPTRGAAPPDAAVPRCYLMTPPALNAAHFQKFDVETLFYIFYSMPRDLPQAAAAHELHTRDWRYHNDLKLWFTRGADPAHPHQAAFFYWDVTLWERRMASSQDIQNLSDAWERRAPEVKFPQ
jgi:CCR4-NOT transcription complex subunit 2